MTLEEVYFISQIIAAVSILLSLVFVALQLRQNTEQLRKNQRADTNAFETGGSTLVQNVMLALARDEGLSDLVARGRKGLSNLSEAEQVRFGYYLMASLYHVQFAYQAYRKGSSDDDIWRGHAGSLTPLMRSPGVRDWCDSDGCCSCQHFESLWTAWPATGRFFLQAFRWIIPMRRRRSPLTSR